MIKHTQRPHRHLPRFAAFWFSHTTSLIALQFGALAIPLLAIEKLDSSDSAVAMLTGLGSLPWLLVGVFAGHIVDSVNRQTLLALTHALRSLIVFALVVLGAVGWLTFPMLVVALLAAGSLAVLFEVGRRTFLPAIVPGPQLEHANTRLAATDSLARIAGPGLAGYLIAITSILTTLTLQSALFCASAIAILRIEYTEYAPKDRRKQNAASSVIEGFRYLWNTHWLRSFATSDGGFMFAFSIIQSLTVVAAFRHLGMTAGAIGLVFTSGSIGGLLGAQFATFIAKALKVEQRLALGFFLRSVGATGLLGALVLPSLALPLLIASRSIMSLGWTIWEINQESVQQTLLPNELRGRANSASLLISQGLGALGGFTGAVLASWIGMVAAVGVATVISISTILLLHSALKSGLTSLLEARSQDVPLP